MTVQTPLYLQPKAYPARLDRQLLGDFFNPGVLRGGDLLVAATGNAREVSIARGVAYIAGTVNPDQGTYRLFSDAAVSIVLNPVTTYPRVDLLIARIFDDTELSNNPAGPHYGSIEAVPGVETNGATTTNLAGAPSDISLPPNTIKLAYVLVPVTNGVLPAGNVVDRRPLAGLKPGGTPPIGSIMPYAASGEPGDGYYTMADGKLIDALIYSSFAAKVGHAYNGGVNPGSNRVRVPDKRGRSSVGAADMGTVQGLASGNARVQLARGASGGEVLHALTPGENGPHTHPLEFSPGTNNDFITGNTGTNGNYAFVVATDTGILIKRSTIAVSNSGSGTGHNTVHPVEADNYIVRIA